MSNLDRGRCQASMECPLEAEERIGFEAVGRSKSRPRQPWRPHPAELRLGGPRGCGRASSSKAAMRSWRTNRNSPSRAGCPVNRDHSSGFRTIHALQFQALGSRNKRRESRPLRLTERQGFPVGANQAPAHGFHESRDTRHESRPFIACSGRRVVRNAGWQCRGGIDAGNTP